MEGCQRRLRDAVQCSVGSLLHYATLQLQEGASQNMPQTQVCSTKKALRTGGKE